MAQRDALIFVGAEAEVRRGHYLGLPSVQKRRVPKTYRHEALDARIRKERTRGEALLLAEASAAGVPAPRVLDVDLADFTLELEAIEGRTLREAIDGGDAASASLVRDFGRLVGRLHQAGLVHGDLTTSNVLVRGDGLVLVDFGLAQRSSEVEDRGVDLHVVERTFASSHAARPDLHASFVQGYREASADADAVIARTDEIRERGRYA